MSINVAFFVSGMGIREAVFWFLVTATAAAVAGIGEGEGEGDGRRLGRMLVGRGLGLEKFAGEGVCRLIFSSGAMRSFRLVGKVSDSLVSVPFLAGAALCEPL